MPCTVLAKEKKHTCIKLIVKEYQGLEGSVKEVVKKLNGLSRNMEKTAKLYNTINQKSYWESEAKKTFLKYITTLTNVLKIFI